jgi:multisubunit Na+/H+ antiporter MnhB subunit
MMYMYMIFFPRRSYYDMEPSQIAWYVVQVAIFTIIIDIIARFFGIHPFIIPDNKDKTNVPLIAYIIVYIVIPSIVGYLVATALNKVVY